MEASTSLQSLRLQNIDLSEPEGAERIMNFLPHVKSRHLQTIEFQCMFWITEQVSAFPFKQIDELFTRDTSPALSIVRFIVPGYVRAVPPDMIKVLHEGMPGAASRELLQVEYDGRPIYVEETIEE